MSSLNVNIIKPIDNINKTSQSVGAEQAIKSEQTIDARKASGIGADRDESDRAEDLLAISTDGDTVQASKAGINASTTTGSLVSATEDGAVTQVSEEEKEELVSTNAMPGRADTRTVRDEQSKSAAQMLLEMNANNEKTVNETNSNEEQEVTSLAGMTKQQVEQLYREGRISESAYERNVQERADREEATEDPFARRMGQLNAQAQQEANATEGLLNAMKNGRADIVGDLFTQQS